MDTVPKLSRESHRRLLDVLEDVGDLDSDPNEMLAKAASERGVPREHIHMLVNAYNTGRATIQRQSSDNVWEKAASYPIALTEKVLTLMFPDRYKAASELRSSASISSDYLLPPTWLKRRKTAGEAAQQEKAASVKPAPVEPPLTVPDARSRIAAMKKKADVARQRRDRVADMATLLSARLSDYFLKQAHEPFQAVRTNCKLAYGDAAVRLLDALPLPEKVKSAKALPRPVRGPAYEMVSGCLELREAYAAIEKDYQEKVAEALAESERLSDRLSPPALDRVLNIPIPGARSEFAKNAFMDLTRSLGKSLASGIGANMLNPGRNKSVGGTLESQLTDNVHSMESQAALADLMAGDDVLRQHDPNEVVRAYNAVSGIAPTATRNPEVLRAVLRDRMEKGHQSLFDLDALTKIEKNLRGMGGSAAEENG